MYVLAIDVSDMGDASEWTAWRFYEDEDVAMVAWYRMNDLVATGNPAIDRGKRVQVDAARLYVTELAERGDARGKVLAGEKPIKDTENVLAGFSDEEIAPDLADLIGPPQP
jgi:hypothetical protein